MDLSTEWLQSKIDTYEGTAGTLHVALNGKLGYSTLDNLLSGRTKLGGLTRLKTLQILSDYFHSLDRK